MVVLALDESCRPLATSNRLGNARLQSVVRSIVSLDRRWSMTYRVPEFRSAIQVDPFNFRVLKPLKFIMIYYTKHIYEFFGKR